MTPEEAQAVIDARAEAEKNLLELAAQWRCKEAAVRSEGERASDTGLIGWANGLEEALGELEDFIRYHQGEAIE